MKELIHKKQYHVLKIMNTETINLYWEIGEEIYRQQEINGWGKSIVKILSKELQKEVPGAKGYSAANLWRMRNFYLSYRNSEKLAPLVRYTWGISGDWRLSGVFQGKMHSKTAG